MQDKPVSIRRSSFLVWVCRVSASIAIGVMLVVSVWAAIKMREVTSLSRELDVMQAEVSEIHKASETRLEEAVTRLENIEKSLYGDVYVKLSQPVTTTKPQTMRVEAWMQNQVKTLSERLSALERHRLIVEGELDALRETLRK